MADLNQSEITDIISRVTPNDIGQLVGLSEEIRAADEIKRRMGKFDALMARSCIAAFRLVPFTRPEQASPSAIQWAARDYLLRLVAVRNLFATRVARKLGAPHG